MDGLTVTFAGASVQLTLTSITALETADVTDGKLAGFLGCNLSSVVDAARAAGLVFNNTVGGKFVASDGVESGIVASAELGVGVVVYADADGAPLATGGPLRLVYPEGVAVQASVCGKNPGPLQLKMLVRLELA